MTFQRQLALVALPLAVLAACGGDDDGDTAEADPQPFIDAAAASMTADEDLPFDQEAATCISTAVVDVIGADALVRAEVTPEEFAGAGTFNLLAGDLPDDAPALLRDNLGDCDSAEAVSSAFVTELGIDVTPEDVACIAGGLDRQALNDALADSFLATTDDAGQGLQDILETTLLDAVIACPRVITATFLAQAPGTVTPETEACVSTVVEANPDRVRAAFGGDAAATEALGTEIGTSCAGAFGG